MTRKPNLIMIMTDEMRGDCMGYAGHPDVKTPYLDTLAAQGIYYPNAPVAFPQGRLSIPDYPRSIMAGWDTLTGWIGIIP